MTRSPMTRSPMTWSHTTRSRTTRPAWCALLLPALALSLACKEEERPPAYQTLPVERRNIVVTAQAAGTIQPDTTVEVKSKASGEILDLPVETGRVVRRGDLLASIDPRVPRNTLAQAQADLDVAKARLANATSQRRRADELFQTRSITDQEHEQALLDQANANAEVVRAQVAVDNARDQLDDTKVRAPIDGTILAKQVERGQVISSPTRDVGGGTVLLTMADLELVQVRTLVDETDIGKIKPGQPATVTVEAYPNRPFEGTVLKIEPQALTEQNVTTFPVLVRIDNREGLLRPGMNAEVEIHIGERSDVLAIPNAALRTPRDVGSAAQVLGIPDDAVQQLMTGGTGRNGRDTGNVSTGANTGANASAGSSAGAGASPPASLGSTPARETRAESRRSGRRRPRSEAGMGTEPGATTAAGARQAGAGTRTGASPAGGARGNGTRGDRLFGGRYIVFVRRAGQTTPVWVRTGLTDLDYSEVVSGLEPSDSVLLLPSASLVQSREQQQQRINERTRSGMGGAPVGRPR
jgi:HlyD family secretion protein